MRFLLLFVAIFPFWCEIEGANILFMAPLASPSHHNWNRNLYVEMAKRGHNVTVLSVDKDKEPTKNLHYILMEGVYEALHDSNEAVDLIEFAKLSEWGAFEAFWHWCSFNSRLTAASKGIQTLLNYPDNFKFDLIVDDLSMAPFILGFIHKFNYPPAVAVTPFSVPHYFTRTFGGHRQPSYVSHHGSQFSDKMSFYERIVNYLFYLVDDYYMAYHVMPEQESLMRQVFGRLRDLPTLETLQSEVGLALVNVHPAVEQTFPLPPNMIPVGGLQVRDPKPLDPPIKTFIESGKEGTVLFSLGTNVKSEMLDTKTKEMFIKVFAELPQYNFLWKYESDLTIPLPKNVMIRPWLKQSDILAHENLKAFISHCGLMSTQEATWRGIPVVGMPFFADQRRNAVGIVNRGTGVRLDVFTLTKEKFKAALLDVLLNPKYTQNAKSRARVFQDQMEKPIDRAIYWLEWAMRHGEDMQVIQSPVKELGWFVGNGYDVMLFGLLIVLVGSWALLKTCKVFCCGRKKRCSKETKEKSN
ncbi:UDP-glucosyltransferase 2-like [Culicoides brevitarsis]|uniref:UDP-glucosyltransferase 2-like n=1 Tax=Culicoides brevitarsis TaxID=469753 RepID=UPI00307BDBB8